MLVTEASKPLSKSVTPNSEKLVFLCPKTGTAPVKSGGLGYTTPARERLSAALFGCFEPPDTHTDYGLFENKEEAIVATHLNLPIEIRQIGDTQKQTIDARALHERLGVATQFRDWIVRRVSQYGFKEHRDFCCSNSSGSENQGLSEKFGNLIAGRNRIDYFVTVDMAKNLGLIENTPVSQAIRDALIAMEDRVRKEIPILINSLQQELLIARPDWKKIQRYEAMGLSQTEIATLVGVKSSAMRDKLKRMSACKLVDYTPNQRMVELGRKGREAQLQMALEGGKA